MLQASYGKALRRLTVVMSVSRALVLELVISVRVITHRATIMAFRLRQSRAYF